MNHSPSGQVHLLTFDIEHWFEGYRYRGYKGWETLPPRDPATVERVLNMLAEFGVTATFFVTGQFGADFPSVVADIANRGHEVASHSFDHLPIGSLGGPSGFRDALRRSIDTLESAGGQRILGFRAPGWVMPRSIYTRALEIIAGEGLVYDSSRFPRGVGWRAKRVTLEPHQVDLPSGARLWEFPASVVEMACVVRIPAAGGFFLRLFPTPFTRATLGQAAAAGRPGLVYVHPYDLDPSCPRLGGSLHFKLMRYHRLGKTEGVLRELLASFRFMAIRDWMRQHQHVGPTK